jgi:hypothetical protein
MKPQDFIESGFVRTIDIIKNKKQKKDYKEYTKKHKVDYSEQQKRKRNWE